MSHVALSLLTLLSASSLSSPPCFTAHSSPCRRLLPAPGRLNCSHLWHSHLYAVIPDREPHFPSPFTLRPFVLFPPAAISTCVYLLSKRFLPPGAFPDSGALLRGPLLLAGSKMELLGEACGIWDLRAPAGERGGWGVPSPAGNFAGGGVTLQTPAIHSCD